jgi:hypothetical protein
MMQSCLAVRNYPGIYLEGLRNITKTLSQDNKTPDLDLNLGLSEFIAGMLATFSVLRY